MGFLQRTDPKRDVVLSTRPLDVTVVRKRLPRSPRLRPRRPRTATPEVVRRKPLRVERLPKPAPEPPSPSPTPPALRVSALIPRLAPLPPLEPAMASVALAAGSPPADKEGPRPPARIGSRMGAGGVYGPGEVDRLPVRIRRIEPLYPASARRFGLTGWVALEFVITVKGTTRDIRVVDSKGGRRFEEAAVSAVRGWRYRPGTIHGQPVPVRGAIKIIFRLEE
jgi:protein TonB